MGLMYLFPTSKAEPGFVFENEDQLEIKSYGLPPIFWLYAVAIFIVTGFMYLAVRSPLQSLINYPDIFNKLIYTMVHLIFLFIPSSIIFFLLFQKKLTKKKSQLNITFSLLNIVFYKKNIDIRDGDYKIEHFLDSPNLAKMQNAEGLKGFENKGYFILNFIKNSGERFFIDRSSRKIDLEKLKELLS